MVRRELVVAVSLTIGVAAPQAMQLDLDRRAVEEALSLGQSRIGTERTRFHDPYRMPAGTGGVDVVHVVTPFRRLVVAAEERARLGGSTLGQRDAIDILGAAPDRLDVYVEVSFHPLNTFLGVPPYEVALARPGDGRLITPKTLERYPRYGPRVEGGLLPNTGSTAATLPRGSQPLLGATLLATFDARTLDPNGRYDVATVDAGTVVARVPIDLSRLR